MTIKQAQPGISYLQYCTAIASMSKPDNQVEALSLPKPLQQFITDAKQSLQEIADSVKIGFADLLKAFASRDAWKLLKSIGFNIKILAKSIVELGRLLGKGLVASFQQLSESAMMDKLRKKLISVNEVMDQYPVLKLLGKVALAGLLFWMWLNCSFIGDAEYDFSLQMVVEAFTGHYTIVNLLTEADGLAFVALFALGFTTGLGVTWLAAKGANILVAICFTLFKHAGKSTLASKLRPLLKSHSV